MPIIRDLKAQALWVPIDAQAQGDVAGPRMAGDVVQRLLGDAEDRFLGARGQPPVVDRRGVGCSVGGLPQIHGHFGASAVRQRLALLTERIQQAGCRERRGAELPQQRGHLGQGGLGRATHVLHRGARARQVRSPSAPARRRR